MRRASITNFVTRVGGALVAPASTQGAVAAGGPGGVRDLLLLLALQVVAVQLPVLAGAVLTMLQLSYSAGISLLLNTVAASAWMPLAAAVLGGVVLGWLTRGRPPAARDRNLDLAALAAVPAVCLQLAASLVVAALHLRPPRWVAIGVLAAGGLWFLVLLLVAVGVVRRQPSAPAPEAS